MKTLLLSLHCEVVDMCSWLDVGQRVFCKGTRQTWDRDKVYCMWMRLPAKFEAGLQVDQQSMRALTKQ